MEQIEIKLKCIDLAFGSGTTDVLNTAKELYKWVIDNRDTGVIPDRVRDESIIMETGNKKT